MENTLNGNSGRSLSVVVAIISLSDAPGLLGSPARRPSASSSGLRAHHHSEL